MNARAWTFRSRAVAQRAAHSSAVETGARWGLAARGAIYLLIGVLALEVAFGSDGGREADRGGALEELSAQPFGTVLLWAVGAGLVGMVLWRLSEALFGAAGPDGRKARKRALSAARCVFYAFVAYSVLAFAVGDRGSGSSDRQSRDITARALELPAGQWIVGIGGVGIACAGVWIGVRAALRKYRKHLRTAAMSRRARRAVDVTGVAGGVARGLVFAVAGGFATRAALTYDPSDAKGLDDTLRTFAATAAGPSLLVATATGLALFGVFSFLMARWRRV
ncbi:DUF1206 domain-containing protein [Streptomyces sp. PKU-MA01144]|uniref:DUF1206 domain-containing protein n=1 Tax=Streptomyces sp. PKU-MA01144 TaxID=2729138 RepID=UPI00147F1371|nr:DUF1206 domain-containing protein [Streptomyces sp. PKU-MA01144]NNJ06257.1 DUF1206 domain-containing protein [Streptomyces sp. PKU-MA01144]